MSFLASIEQDNSCFEIPGTKIKSENPSQLPYQERQDDNIVEDDEIICLGSTNKSIVDDGMNTIILSKDIKKKKQKATNKIKFNGNIHIYYIYSETIILI